MYEIMIKSLLVILALSAPTIRSQVITPKCKRKDACSCTYEDGGIVQLKFLGEYIKKESEYLTVSHQTDSGTDTYNFNPCSPFTVKVGSECDGVLACQHHPDLYDIGRLQPYPPEFSDAKNGDLIITYNDKSGYQRSSEVTCVCDSGYTGMPYFTSQGEKSGATFLFEMHHACCCKDTCKDAMPPPGSGLSGGSVLLILAIVVLVIYLVFGGLFMKYKRGAIGTEMIPNKSFWSELPALMKDGVLFVLSPCSKRGAYSQV